MAPKLVAELSDPRWHTREKAAEGLRNIGPAAYEALRRAFHGRGGFDLRRQIRNVVHDIYLSNRLGPPRAFLGISHQRVVLRNTQDGRVPPGWMGLGITDVFSDLSADRAGVRPGDVFVMLNGQAAMGEEDPTRFTKWIAAQRPGTPCTLGVIRGGEGVRLDTSQSPGFKPREFVRIKVREVPSRGDLRIPEGSSGLMVLDATAVDARTGLKPGDLIIGIDDRLFPPDGAASRLLEWARAFAEPAAALDTPGEPGKGGPPVPTPRIASLQYLRGGQRLELHATLGRRPAYLRPLPEEIWNADAATIESAEAAFGPWWEAEFDSGGRYAPEAAEDPLWKMEPGAGPREPGSAPKT